MNDIGPWFKWNPNHIKVSWTPKNVRTQSDLEPWLGDIWKEPPDETMNPGWDNEPWMRQWTLDDTMNPVWDNEPWMRQWTLDETMNPGWDNEPWMRQWTLDETMNPGWDNEPWMRQWTLDKTMNPGWYIAPLLNRRTEPQCNKQCRGSICIYKPQLTPTWIGDKPTHCRPTCIVATNHPKKNTFGETNIIAMELLVTT